MTSRFRPSHTPAPHALASSAFAKLDRADEHLDTLYRATDGWGDGDPFTVSRQCNADGTHHVFTLHYRVHPDVWGWGVLLGDALHNLRGALDNIVYGLAIHQTGQDPPDDDSKLAFPITSEGRFESSRWRLGSLSDETVTAIERLQPNARAKPGNSFHPLWFLQGLNDVDKHRAIHVCPVAAHPDDIAIDAAPGTFTAIWRMGPLVDGTPFLHIRLTEPNPNVYVDLQATAAVVIQTVGQPPVSLYWTTRHMRREARIAVRYLAQFLLR